MDPRRGPSKERARRATLNSHAVGLFVELGLLHAALDRYRTLISRTNLLYFAKFGLF